MPPLLLRVARAAAPCTKAGKPCASGDRYSSTLTNLRNRGLHGRVKWWTMARWSSRNLVTSSTSSPARGSALPSLRLTKLEFASILSYIPREGGGDLGDQSRDMMRILKDGRMIGSPPAPLADLIVSLIKSGVPGVADIASLFRPTTLLVPVPKSSLFKEGSLWVPEQIANSFVRSGLGDRSARLLSRTRAIAKAATSLSSGRPRPTAIEHIQTLSVQTELTSAEEIVLIDDVVTTGSTLLGCANKLLESYPSTPIRGFAAMRAVSNPLDFKHTLDPVVGSITLRSGGHCHRQP